MGSKFFIGEPPSNIKQWIMSQKPTIWGQILKNLETFPEQTFTEMSSPDSIESGVLPSVGSTLSTRYKICADGESRLVDIEWYVMGYNQSIPEMVKYKNGDQTIYVKTTSDGLLTSTLTEHPAYSDKTKQQYIDVVADVGSQTFTYGNGNGYSVPTTITVGSTTYQFAGYNMTLWMKCSVGVEAFDGTFTYELFMMPPYTVVWSLSEIRDFLNNSSTSRIFGWENDHGDASSTTTTFVDRLDDKFLESVMPTVNRTYVQESLAPDVPKDQNNCTHDTDKFWVLGAGDLGLEDTPSLSFDGAQYDTARYTPEYVSYVHYPMGADGQPRQPFYWNYIVRTPCTSKETGDSAIGVIYDDGYEIRPSAAAVGICPACTIG